MGLLSKTVKVKPYFNKSFWEGKGYILPKNENNGKRNSILMEVDVKDLPLHSDVLVKVKCDYCNFVREIRYEHYTKQKHNGNYYCNKCHSKVLLSGSNSPRWNPNLSSEDREERTKTRSKDLSNLRREVLHRDKYKCFCCKTSNKSLVVHHLNGWNWFIKGRYDINNCVTLCRECHNTFHKIYGKGNNCLIQFKHWLGIKYLNFDNTIVNFKKREVYCLETKEVIEDYDYFIKRCCDKKVSTYCKKHYVYYSDYLKNSVDTKIDKRDVPIISLENFCIYRNQKEFAIQTNRKSSSMISQCIHGKVKMAYGLHWDILENYLTNKDENELDSLKYKFFGITKEEIIKHYSKRR